MTRTRRPILPCYLLLLLLAVAVAAALITIQPSFTWDHRAIRAAALLGYVFIFLAIVSSNYMQPLVRRFGRPFVTLHHWVSITGLVLVTLHPILLALTGGGLAVFVPEVSSWRGFWTYAGRPAWVLLLIAAAAAGVRNRFKNGWRIVHYLVYVAFAFGGVHATLLGTSFVISPVARIAVYLLVALALGVFVFKRYSSWQRTRARARRSS